MKVHIDTATLAVTVQNADDDIRTFDLGAALGIDEANLSQEFTDQPALYAWWGALAERAMADYRIAAVEFGIAEARAYKRIRSQALIQKDKMTEARLKQEVEADDTLAALRRDLVLLRQQSDAMKTVLKSVEEKGKMLMTLGGFKRAEMGMTGAFIKG